VDWRQKSIDDPKAAPGKSPAVDEKREGKKDGSANYQGGGGGRLVQGE